MRLAALFLASLCLEAATLAERIEKILSEPAAQRAFWGVKAVDLGSGQTLYEHNPDRLFIPASNTKLFSTALGLVRLGPEYRFLTRVAAEAPPDNSGRIAGDVVLIGGGDPSLSARVLPYDARRQFSGHPFQALEELAAEVAALGVRQIDGDIVGDDTYYSWEPYAVGWAYDDTTAGYGAPVSALILNDNTVTLEIRPGDRVGEPALARIEPWTGAFALDNRIRTAAVRSAPRAIQIHRVPGDPVLRLWGEIGLADRGRSETLAIDDPALFAAQALRDALLRRSIAVSGRATSRHAMPYETAAERGYGLVLASRSSMPLMEGLRVINKVSQNLHAEVVLREAARQRRGAGSIEASLAELKAFLAEIGIRPEEFSFQDGSGLSRRNLISPAAVVTLLTHMWNSPHRDQWLETLPVAALDGTLKGRFAATPAAERLRAKTGTLSHVSALSGYLEAPPDRRIAFAVLVNNYNEEPAGVRALIDKLCLAMLEP